MKFTTVTLLILFLFAMVFNVHEIKSYKKETIAILRFEISNLSKNVGNQVYNRLCKELTRAGKASIVSSNGISFSSSNNSYTNPNKIIKAAKSVHAKKAITGMAGKMGSSYIISLKVTDIKTRKTKQRTKDCNGSINTFLNKTVPDVAKQILW